MATWSAGNLLVRLREVIETGAGTLRTTTSGKFKGQLPPGLDANEESRRALLDSDARSVPVESRVTSIKRSASSPSEMGNIALYDVNIEVRAVYPVATAATLTDATRDQIAGLAYQHADTLAQALGYAARNLATTTAGASTGLVSGGLAYVGSDYSWAGDAGKGGTLTARHRFKGIAQSAPAVS